MFPRDCCLQGGGAAYKNLVNTPQPRRIKDCPHPPQGRTRHPRFRRPTPQRFRPRFFLALPRTCLYCTAPNMQHHISPTFYLGYLYCYVCGVGVKELTPEPELLRLTGCPPEDELCHKAGAQGSERLRLASIENRETHISSSISQDIAAVEERSYSLPSV